MLGFIMGTSKRKLLSIFLLLHVFAGGSTILAQSEPPRVRIDFFYEPGCDECLRVRTRLLPELEARYSGLFELHQWDLGVDENYFRLLSTMKRMGIDDNAHVYMLLADTKLLCGYAGIEKDMFPVLDEVLSGGSITEAPPGVQDIAPVAADALRERVDEFTLLGVILGGLADGINPCAISTLVFLISVLSLAKVRGRQLLLVGGVFCLASFLTYSAIGFGLLRALHLLRYFSSIQRAVDLTLIAILFILAAVSIKDAIRFRATRDAAAVSLRLPERFSAKIHGMLRKGIGQRAQLTSAFGLGCVVTGIESVCTGQVYVPTLALVVKRGTDVSRGLMYLGIYNIMFIMPLIVVLLLTYRGMRLFRLIEWSRSNVIASKLLMAAFFLGLAVLILWMN